MKRQQWYGISDKWKRARLTVLALTAVLILLSGTSLAASFDVVAQDISLGEEICLTVTHDVELWPLGWVHRVSIEGPDGYDGEHLLYGSFPQLSEFGSPSEFPTPAVAGEYAVSLWREVFDIKAGIWICTLVAQTTFTVTGGSPPTIICPGNIATNTDPGSCGAVVEWCVMASGDPMPTVTCIPASASTFPLGATTVTCTATNEYGSANCSFAVTVIDSESPTMSCPSELVLNCDNPEKEQAFSEWLNADIASDNCDLAVAISHDAPLFADLPIEGANGSGTIVTWTATDASGNTATCSSTVKLLDTTPPELAIVLTPSTLWPANHKLVEVTALIQAEDNYDPNPTIALVSISSNEPDETIGVGDGKTLADVQEAMFGDADLEFLLRAERQGTSGGRVYTISYTATDACGNVQLSTAEVLVPHRSPTGGHGTRN